MSIQCKPLIQMITIFKILAHQNHNNIFQNLSQNLAVTNVSPETAIPQRYNQQPKIIRINNNSL